MTNSDPRRLIGINLHTIEKMGSPIIRLMEDADSVQVARMRASLWPDAPFEDHLQDLENVEVGGLPSETFVAVGEDGSLVGFLDVGLRSHADGCNPVRPVGFVEGWFVMTAFRKKGIGGALMRAAENWAREQGSVEMASDTWIGHEESERAHVALGFEVVDRCVHFRKQLASVRDEPADV